MDLTTNPTQLLSLPEILILIMFSLSTASLVSTSSCLSRTINQNPKNFLFINTYVSGIYSLLSLSGIWLILSERYHYLFQNSILTLISGSLILFIFTVLFFVQISQNFDQILKSSLAAASCSWLSLLVLHLPIVNISLSKIIDYPSILFLVIFPLLSLLLSLPLIWLINYIQSL